MYLSVVSPIGHATSLDLTALPLWRLELRAMPVPLTSPQVKGLALGIGFVAAGGTSAFAAIVCLNCKIPGDDLNLIVTEGLPKVDRLANKEHLREGLKVLVNSLVTKEMEDIQARSAKLVDTYHDILEGLWATERDTLGVMPGNPTGTGSGGQSGHRVVAGSMEGWRWALVPERFQAWDMRVEAPSTVSALNATPTVRPVDVNAPPPTAPMTMGPAPSALAMNKVATSTDDNSLGPMDPLGPAPGMEKPRKNKK